MTEYQIALAVDIPPIGSSLNWNGAGDPAGGIWLVEDGRSLSRTTYPDLFTALGGTASPWGLTTGAFNLPDKRGRTDIGSGTGTGLTTRAVGDASGTEFHVLTAGQMPSHSHGGSTGNGGSHDHSFTAASAHQHTAYGNKAANSTPAGGSFDVVRSIIDAPGGSGTSGLTSSSGGHDHGFVASTNHSHTISTSGADGAHNNMQPFIARNSIIRVR